ncbi:TetR family transcriptional regulator [Murinocardiopsis flavida]|uniref:TetR family transcriptional regulator n=1 Tax=Murinocardiopsis flavida TaxID=645275 RepID=A0A2P8DMB9_9ACTN|nr:TetR/AcrR family transcriptional regulator [Murinocardiopsis flavida]PSK98347.1 TetR family transcriptional regulator [Murinocardiopsis flavida]
MARTDTRERIRSVALELFAQNGFESTSLREIAERLGITKAALYYHFPSKNDLLAELVLPLTDDMAAMLSRVEAAGTPARTVIEETFDLFHRHRPLFQAVVNDFAALGRTGVVPLLLDWRTRVVALLTGPDPSPEEQARVLVALGGLQDSAVMLPGIPVERYRAAAIDASCRALGG